LSNGFIPAPAPAAFSLAARLIRYAARNAPPALAERLEEEWLADLTAQPSSFAGLSLALGCCWAARVIERHHRAASAAVSARGSKSQLVGQFRSLSMNSFKWLWTGGAALAITALVICVLLLIPVGLRESVLPLLSRYRAYFADSGQFLGFWFSLLVSWAIMLGTIVLCWRQMPVERSHEGVPSLPEIRARGRFILPALVLCATCGLLFFASARIGSVAMHIPEPGLRMGVSGLAVWMAVTAAGFLICLVILASSRRKRLRSG